MLIEIPSIVRALAGGLLIGTGTVLLLLFNGRIAGISGIFGRLAALDGGPGLWRAAFVLGLLLATGIALAAGVYPPAHVQGGLLLAAMAGLLSGVGTGLAQGCTSGHGVCGLSNLSLRSLVATVTFMAVAALTVYLAQHLAWGR